MICDIEPRPDSHRIGPVAAGKLLARKRPHLLPVYDSRVKKVLNRPRTDNRWWHDLRDQLISDQNLVRELESVRRQSRRGPHVPPPRLRRDVLDVQLGRRTRPMRPTNVGLTETSDGPGSQPIWHVHWKQDRHLPAQLRPDNHHRSLPLGILEAVRNEPALPQSVTISPDASV